MTGTISIWNKVFNFIGNKYTLYLRICQLSATLVVTARLDKPPDYSLNICYRKHDAGKKTHSDDGTVSGNAPILAR
jgi:hypothetical protein